MIVMILSPVVDVFKIVGAEGVSTGVTEEDCSDTAPAPIALTARILTT